MPAALLFDPNLIRPQAEPRIVGTEPDVTVRINLEHTHALTFHCSELCHVISRQVMNKPFWHAWNYHHASDADAIAISVNRLKRRRSFTRHRVSDLDWHLTPH